MSILQRREVMRTQMKPHVQNHTCFPFKSLNLMWLQTLQKAPFFQTSGSQMRATLPPTGGLHYLEASLLAATACVGRRVCVLLTPGEQRPEVPLNILKYMRQPLQHRVLWFKTSIVPSVRNPVLNEVYLPYHRENEALSWVNLTNTRVYCLENTSTEFRSCPFTVLCGPVQDASVPCRRVDGIPLWRERQKRGGPITALC